MSQPPQTHSKSPPSLTIDWERYGALLEDYEATDAQKRDLIKTLWCIVVSFFDLGFDLKADGEICGQSADPLSDTPPDLLSLLSEEMHHSAKEDPCQD